MSTRAYRIRTLDDLMTIPPDRLDVFLSELGAALRAAAALTALAHGAGVPKGAPVFAFGKNGFLWEDDGKRDLTVNLDVSEAGA